MPEETRRAFGADRLEAGGGGPVLVCPAPKSWKPRKGKTLTSAEYPGTAVEWGGGIFEVLQAEHLQDGGMRYRLAPWAEGHAIRRLEQYDEASERAREGEQIDRRDSVRKRRLSFLLAPLVGLLPGAKQKEMEIEFGAPALAMTISSALPLFVIGLLGVFERFLGGLGGGIDLPVWLTPPIPIALYLFAESALRLASAIGAGEPMGSLPVVIAYEAWQEARGPSENEPESEADPGNADAGEKDAAAAPPIPETERDAFDRYQMLEVLLSLLSPAEQKVLMQRFHFDPIRWGKITAAVLLLVGGGNALAGLLNLTAGRWSVIDAAWILVGGFLTVEQLRRWRQFKAGEPAGSVLAPLVRPMTRALFETPCRLADPDPP
jgi:hypothetical protein